MNGHPITKNMFQSIWIAVCHQHCNNFSSLLNSLKVYVLSFTTRRHSLTRKRYLWILVLLHLPPAAHLRWSLKAKRKKRIVPVERVVPFKSADLLHRTVCPSGTRIILWTFIGRQWAHLICLCSIAQICYCFVSMHFSSMPKCVTLNKIQHKITKAAS